MRDVPLHVDAAGLDQLRLAMHEDTALVQHRQSRAPGRGAADGKAARRLGPEIDHLHQPGRPVTVPGLLRIDGDDVAIRAVVEELTDRYGPLPESVRRLVAVARLRLLSRQYGITEVTATGGGSGTTLRVSPLTLLDSQQLRLKRLYPSAHYRATTSTVQVPIPRAGDGVASARIRDLELLQMVADLVLALDGKPQGGVDITEVKGAEATREGVR